MGLVASMTGYGRGEARGARVAVAVEVRALNHRFLEANLKLPRNLAGLEPDVRRLVQGRLARGRVDVTAALRRLGGSASVVRADIELAAEHVRTARAVAVAVGIPPDLGLADLLRLPGVVTVEEADEELEDVGPLLKAAVEEALDDLCRMRQTEGAALRRELSLQLDGLSAWTRDLEAILPAALARIQARMRERILALSAETPADPARLAQEVATWAAKSDIAEELARLTSHGRQLGALLDQGGAVGRQLDFLAQELHREVNTIASKADDHEMIARILPGRTLVERIREQVQNVE
jgi:uncharacterized protein (TIGR00255 family)